MTQAAALAAYGSNSPSNRNRIINGDMRIDQRNAGASVTIGDSENAYIVDRFSVYRFSSAVLTAKQDSVAPSGFNNSLKITVTTADASIGSTEQAFLRQRIEGYNVADCGFGAAGAAAVTLSFWVRSSVTGTFSGALQNGATDRSYPFTYSISAADTWEQKTITVAGDTTGTWLTTNGVGLQVVWSLGVGSSFQGTAGAWASGAFRGATGETQLISTLNATFYITGVQLEAGSVATPFEHRQYGQELALCQRYYFKLFPAAANRILAMGQVNNSTEAEFYAPFVVTMRTSPSALETNGTAGDYKVYSADANTAATAVTHLSYTTNYSAAFRFSVASGLTAGRAASAYTNTGATTAFLAWSAEL
jgi:hypothetical protein